MELAKAYETEPHRQVWVQEIGAPLSVMTEQDSLDFMMESVRRMVGGPDLFGITWWCSHDVNRDLADFPPLEYSLGLFDQDGRLKDLGRVFQKVVGQYAQQDTEGHNPDETGGEAFVLPADQRAMSRIRSACAPGGKIFDQWMEEAKTGRLPVFVNEETATDKAYLKERDIDDLVFFDELAR